MEMETSKFSEMEIKKEIKMAIKEMGFEEATPIQKSAIPIVLTGKDFIGIAQTGTGKTCAFAVPAIQKVDLKSDNVQVLILCPTRELVIQTCEEIQMLSSKLKGLKTVAIYGGQRIDRQIIGLKKKPQIIVGTPGRIMDHMRRKTIKFDNIEMFILDEADEMLNMGFREDLDIILANANVDRQTVLFSATMSKDILSITKKYQKKDVQKVQIEHKNITAPKIKQYLITVSEAKKLDVISRILDVEDINLSVVFCNTKRKVDELCDHLRVRGYQVEALHGDMKQSQRDIVMRKFKSGKTNLLIATDVAARGIDVENIEVIFNYDIPSDEEYYVHRIGRTGRAGKEGKAITFVASKEMYKIRNIQKYTNVSMEDYKIPSAKSINDKKIEKIMEKIMSTINAEDLEEEMVLIQKYLEDTECQPLEVAAAFLKLKFSKSKVEEIATGSENRNTSGDRVKLFMTVGKKDGFKRSSLKDYIADTVNISKRDILDTEVLDKFSFITVTNSVAKPIVDKIDGSIYNDRKVAIEISLKKSRR